MTERIILLIAMIPYTFLALMIMNLIPNIYQKGFVGCIFFVPFMLSLYQVFRKEKKQYSSLPPKENNIKNGDIVTTNNIKNNTNKKQDNKKGLQVVTLTEKQKVVIVILLCRLVNIENVELYKKKFNLTYPSELYSTLQAYELRSAFVHPDQVKEYLEPLYDILITIKDKKIINLFISLCYDKSGILVKRYLLSEFDSLLQRWGLTRPEVENKIIGIKTTSSTVKQKPEEPITLLEQKTALLKLVVWLSREETLETNKEIIAKCIKEFSSQLGLTCLYNYIPMPTMEEKDKCVKVISIIQDENLLLSFINMCRKIIFLESKNCIWTQYDLEMILKDLKFNNEDIKALISIESKYIRVPKFQPIETLPKRKIKESILKEDVASSKESISVTKESRSENLPIFKQTWSFIEFYKKFDDLKMGEFSDKYRKGKTFKACIFTKDNDYIFAGFYNMKALSIEEIQQQKLELKIGIQNNNRYYIFKGNVPYTDSGYIDLGI